ncbi:hypothetical protein ABZ826_39180 [Streptomyces sp. NPDC047515]|uniref:hypothetical protein n=1 Tax=Streptomyces sp. NPDC047515 TaxID=3155380 RepID=UPI0034055754
MIDRYGISCRPIRDLLVDYLRERQPALDYNSQEALSYYLAKLFWSDLERHHRGISSLHLPREIAEAWKQRLRTVNKTTRTPDGQRITDQAPRINYRECLTPVRAFYLDLAHWAVEDPARWAQWVAPCPVGSEEINRKKDKRRRKSRMDARTRERLPVLPALVRSVDRRRRDAAALLAAARNATDGETFSAAGLARHRYVSPHAVRRQRRSWPPISTRACGVTSDARRTTPSGPSPWLRCCEPPASASRSSASSPTTVWSNTGCPPPAS